jgi:hypothetical protein
MKKAYLIILNFFFFLSSFFFFISPLSAYDFGLVVNANGGYGNITSEDGAFDYKVDVLPRFSTLIGDNGEFILSAGLSIGKDEQDFFYIPELLRTEFSMRFGNSSLKVGRINFSDPLSFIADGLFDGIQYYYNSGAGSFRIGAWYTGFQYKKRANIIMTENDQTAFFKPFDYDDFFNTYFASKRVISSVGWEHPSVGEFLHLNTAFVGQTDLNGDDTKYHSQYVILKAGIPINNFLMEFGGSVELSQTVVDEEKKFNMAFAGEIGLFLLFPSKFNSRLSFTGIIAGGGMDDLIGAFTPITGNEYGYILKSKITGLSVFSLNYSSKFSSFLDASFTASYFVRNDLGTFNIYPVTADNEGYFLGPEASVRITWSPTSDLQFNLGGGAFFPSLGDVGPKEDIRWRVELSVIMSIL